uniref:Uncharacterized protein n=1 Tax=Chromera velia CCMP2878 TaxID=1169474 RepID=A0A0G4FFI7_9ALVE|eukprot:Cvel_16614.t1-p1 / transcript=Cvel_16614.t1 / gene=Cvel_16614 / organism=Chromera_velia_CCMP2878 / gene_product=hypothetical protein / transcript_product=hypothetical protein / location=Cvel_scaffold1287:29746-43508(-) / protein_length=169 / sequence_SO=supercontig / SO=protein_coding / is_pseudo=false
MGHQCRSISSTLSGFLHWIRCLERSLYPFSDASAYDPGSSFPRSTVQPSPGMSSYSRDTTQVEGFSSFSTLPPLVRTAAIGGILSGPHQGGQCNPQQGPRAGPLSGLHEPFNVCKDIPPIQIVSLAGRADTGATTISSFVLESKRTRGQPSWTKGSRGDVGALEALWVL